LLFVLLDQMADEKSDAVLAHGGAVAAADDEAAAEAVGKKRKFLFVLASAVAAITLTKRRRVAAPKDPIPAASMHNMAPVFEAYLQNPGKYREVCRFTPDETYGLLSRLGYTRPEADGQEGRWKYIVVHRFMAFLMSMANYKAFVVASWGRYRSVCIAFRSS
jgi:hypothetical protein